MRCQECGLENRGGVRFCEECGARLEATCPSCGTAVPLGRRFCGRCGQPLAAAPTAAPLGPAPGSYTPGSLAQRILSSRETLAGERKQVTVLFADMRGSLEMLGDRDPEDVRALLDPILTRMMDAVHHHEGTVNQVLGDGIMALFGAPLAHEDHAVRACHAALDMQAAVARHAATLQPGVNVEIRIGLNSGEVVVGSIGNDLHMDYTAVGQTTHLAGRMEQLARPGTTLLTSATRRLVEGYMETRPLGPTPIKGLVAPIEVFELVGRGPVRTRLDATRARAFTRFVGRAEEIETLARAAAEAGRGHGQLVAVVGEPGVGKSRLVDEFTHGRLDGWRLVETGTVSYARGAASVAIVGLLRGYLGIADDEGRRQVEERVAASLATLPLGDASPATFSTLVALLAPSADDSVWQALEPTERRQRTLEAVSRLLLGHSGGEPLCLVVEDLHWADAETQALLDRLASELPAARLLLLVTYRPEHRHGWGGRRDYTQLSLEPLPGDVVADLLDDLLGRGDDLEPVKRRLAARTEGNPFFLEECVRDLIEKGVLDGRRGAYRMVGPAQELDVPASVQSVLAARIDRLPRAEKSLLQAAAAIGTHVPVALLEAIAADVDDLHAVLPRLQAAEFLHETAIAPAPAYRFKHVLTRDVAYGGLLAERRRAIDARIVTGLERLHAEPSAEQVERLAHHAWRGEAWDKAVRWCREAGVHAYSRSAHRAAIEYFEQALAALGHLPRTGETLAQAIDLRLDLRYALMPLGEFRRVLEHLTEAGEQARAAGDRRRLGLVSAFLTNYHNLMGDLDRAVESGRQALAIAAETADPQTEILANATLGLVHYVRGEYAEAMQAARANVRLLHGPRAFERFGSASLPSIYSRTCLAWSLAELGVFAEGAAVADEGLRIAEAARHSFSLVYAHLGVGILNLRKGELGLALEALERAFGLCHDADIPLLASVVALPLASAYRLAQRGGDALRMLEEAGRQAASIGDPVERRVGPGALAEAFLAVGRAADALPLARRYLEERRRLKARGFEAWALNLLGDVLSRQTPAETEEAQACYQDALRIATALGMRPLEGISRFALADLYDQSGKRQDAKAELAAAEDSLRSLGMSYWADQATARRVAWR